MSILNDVIGDALRPLPNAPILRRSAAAGDIDDFVPETPAAPEAGTLTVYRLQMNGAAASPPPAPLIPRPRHASAASSERPLPKAAMSRHDALRPFVHRVSGLETGQESPRAVVPDAQAPLENTFAVHTASRPEGLELVNARERLSSLAPNVDGNPGASMDRENGNDVGRQETGKAAPSGGLFDALAQNHGPGAFGTGTPPFQTDGLASEAGSAPPGVHANAAARFSAPSPATTPKSGDSSPKLSIGRIDVVVLAQPPAAQPAREAPDAAFLSKHYLRRL